MGTAGVRGAVWILPLVAAFVIAARTAGVTATQREYVVTAAAILLPCAAAALIAFAPRLRWSGTACALAASLMAVLVPFCVLVSLSGTRWYFAGPYYDQGFRVEYVTRFADSLRLHDYSYAHTAAFYNPAWFWLTGLSARIAGVAGWVAYKPAAVFTLWVAAVVTFAAWRRCVGPRRGALLTAVTCVALPSAAAAWLGAVTLLINGVYEPYGWVVAAPLPAFVCLWARARGGLHLGRVVVIAFAVALACWTYTEFGALAGVGVVTLALTAPERRERVLEAVAGLTGAGVLLAPWIVPFLVSWARVGLPHSVVGSFTNTESFGPLSFDPTLSPWSIVALVGIVLLVARGSGAVNRGLRHLGGLLVVAAVLQALLGVGGQGLHFHRLVLVGALVALVGGANGIADLWAAHRHALAAWMRRSPGGIELAVMAVALVVGGASQARDIATTDLASVAYHVAYPDGHVPSTRAVTQDGSVVQLRRAVAAVTGGRPAGTLTVLTDYAELLVTTPYSDYEQWWELYASPLGEYQKRLATLQAIARLRNPQEMARQLTRMSDAPDVLILHDDGARLIFQTSSYLPRSNTSPVRTVAFHTSAFTGPCFVTVRAGGYAVIAPKCS